MEIELTKQPKNTTIIDGFPGFGLVGTISTEFLLEHLKTEEIGNIFIEDIPPMVAIHNEKLVKPISIHYNKKYNLIIFHVVTNATGIEWKITKAILKVAEKLKAKELISVEGVNLPKKSGKISTFFYTNDSKKKKQIEKIGVKPLKDGIIVGSTAALILKSHFPTTCFFAETESNLPDSKASAKIIEVLDKYLGLKVDYKPLLKTAENFEGKIRGLLTQSKKVSDESDKKKMSYVG